MPMTAPGRPPKRPVTRRLASLTAFLVAAAAPVGVGAAAVGAGVAAAESTAVGDAPARTPARALRVGSKAFTESVILAEIATQLARAAGVTAEHRSGLGGTRLVWDALVRGVIDVYPEYTGTLIEEILAGAPGAEAPSDAWLARTLASRGIGVIGPLGFNDSYALGVRRELAGRLGLRRISDLRAHPDLRLGFSSEFMSRRDGWPALRGRYGLPQTDVRGLDHDLAYRGLAGGAIDVTDLYATDPEIRRYDLEILADDLHGFRRYDAVLLYRLDLRARADDPTAALARLAGRIDAPAMAAMNARAKLDRVPETRVAADFLQATFGLAPTRQPAPRLASAILHRGAEHLELVAFSLLAAIAVAVPLGILAARRPRAGQLVLGAVGVIQTIPSLALLVFMIPLLGIGALPAMVALFLYSLLPIVRNTHAGLESIPPALRESAQALGLPPGAILRRVSLPLASPMILAGIKSAAVINVGTATLGALIGAGGFGQPIFTGIRLDDVGLILQGALPASLLALLVQGLFEIIERRVVPRGLRVRGDA
jgi:osmoprotectant transport system substrate-binding protein/osmoprotectant transport system permease protein